MIAHVRNDKKINNEKWNQILHGALSQVYKHADTIEFRNRFQSLISIDSHDTSKTGIRFLEEYMKTVARIPEARISRIYHQ